MTKQINKRKGDPAWASFFLARSQGEAAIRLATASLIVSGAALVFAILAYFFPR